MWCGNNHIADAMCVAADINLLSLFTLIAVSKGGSFERCTTL